MARKRWILGYVAVPALVVAAVIVTFDRIAGDSDALVAEACRDSVLAGFPPLARDRAHRFQGKVDAASALCRGGIAATSRSDTPWMDWPNYWATGDEQSKSDEDKRRFRIFGRNSRGIDGALVDLEYQRMELIKFNLFDNQTYPEYLLDYDQNRRSNGALRKVWRELRLPETDPHFGDLKIAPDGAQMCAGALIRFRTVSGICNDIRNPAMGAAGQVFARNVEFESTFPDLGRNALAVNRHNGRIGLLTPDPQIISRRLFSRDVNPALHCDRGNALSEPNDGNCAYKMAPFFNVLGAFWIQFMTHDWFSHLEDARNDPTRTIGRLGCSMERVNNIERQIGHARVKELGCRPSDFIDSALIAEAAEPETFYAENREHLTRAYKTTRNTVTAWWDASQIYGSDEISQRRVHRDPNDSAKLKMINGYLETFRPRCAPGQTSDICDPIQPEWIGQEAVAFPDNWSIGLSFFHNVFAREHNVIVDRFRSLAKSQPNVDSGLRNPEYPTQPITYSRMTDREIFEVARLIVAAEIAKIHTIEWTTQLLYNEPLNQAMNSNWSGLFAVGSIASDVTTRLVSHLGNSSDDTRANKLFAAFAAGSGIVGHGNRRPVFGFLPEGLAFDRWSLRDPDDVNGGTNHFGSPFNFPEEFVSVYRLHPMLPDMLEYRERNDDPNKLQKRIPLIETFRGRATAILHRTGLTNWAVSMGRQRSGTLSLRNHPHFLQNLDLRPRLNTTIDVAALDIIRDRERGIPRYNEFRRQIGLRQLTSFDDFIDRGLPDGSSDLAEQKDLVNALREIYGQHICQAKLTITSAQLDEKGNPITDCLGHADGSTVDNIEDVDLVVGFLAETTRPHGFAISETQFQIFVLNASRRLFSDRFFTSSFRPEFYTRMGIDWIVNNGPGGKQWEEGNPNGHRREISPLKRVLLRVIPDLKDELRHVVNVFDPWARDRGDYYSLAWKPRPDATSDPAFAAR